MRNSKALYYFNKCIKDNSEELNLYNCRFNIDSSELELLDHCTHIKSLLLGDGLFSQYEKNLPYFPIQINSLKKLEYLNASSCSMKFITKLDTPNLTRLDISYNNLSEIENLGDLKNLTCLVMDNNLILKIKNLENNKNIKHLDLSNNKIEKIENLENLINLRRLNLSHNNITKIENLDKLHNLVALDISSNKINIIENLESLTNLCEINLSTTNVENISYLNRLKKLSLLNLIGCRKLKIEDVVENVVCQKNIEVILFSAKGIGIEKFNDVLLNLGSNSFTHIKVDGGLWDTDADITCVRFSSSMKNAIDIASYENIDNLCISQNLQDTIDKGDRDVFVSAIKSNKGFIAVDLNSDSIGDAFENDPENLWNID